MFDYTFQDIVDVLQKLDITYGKSVFIHSNLGFFGKPQGVSSASQLCELFRKALFEVIGSEGTIICPTFSYSFCRKEVFDVENTKGVCGLFSEYIRCHPESLRSIDANFSVAAQGALAKFYTENAPEYSFGKDSFWERFLKRDGIICNFNFDAGSTFLHFIEREAKVSYRWDKPFPGTIISSNSNDKAVFYHFVCDLDKPNHSPDVNKFHKHANKDGLFKQENLGKGTVLAMSSKQTFNYVINNLKPSPNFLIKGEL